MNFHLENKSLYDALTTHLRSNISLDIVLDYESQNRERFHQLYLHFVKIIAEMEDKVESYTKVSWKFLCYVMNWIDMTLKWFDLFKTSKNSNYQKY